MRKVTRADAMAGVAGYSVSVDYTARVVRHSARERRDGDAQVRRFLTDCGFEVVRLKGLQCNSPGAIAHVSEQTLRDAINEVNGEDVDAVLQVGTNLAMARLAGVAEFWLDKLVIAINTATYWWALRQNGIDDKIDGYGSLLPKN